MNILDHITDLKNIIPIFNDLNNTCEDCLLRGDVFSPLSFMYDPDIKMQRIVGIMEGLISFFSVLQFLSGFQLCSEIIQQESIMPRGHTVEHIFTFGYLYALLWLRHAMVASEYVGVIVYGFGVLLYCGYNLAYGYHKEPDESGTYQYPLGRMALLMFFNVILLLADLWIVIIHYIIVTMYYISPGIFMYHCRQSCVWMATPYPMMFMNVIVAILKFARGIVLGNILISYAWAILLASQSVRSYFQYRAEKKQDHYKREMDLLREAANFIAVKHTQGF